MENTAKEIDKLNNKKEIIDQIYKAKIDICNYNSKLDKLIEYYLGDTKSDIVDTFCNEAENGIIGYELKLKLETIYKMICRYEYMYNQNGWEEECEKTFDAL